ncbi:MAG: AAA family ATPase [Methanosarcinales archaeon]|nr:AAA family ATPase [Methanosarcinales archaeon]
MDESDKEFNDLVKLYDEVKKFRIDNSANILKKFHDKDQKNFKLVAKKESVHLFDIDKTNEIKEFENCLNDENITNSIIVNIFNSKKVSLSKNITIKKISIDNKWEIIDNENGNEFIIIKEDNNKIKIHKKSLRSNLNLSSTAVCAYTLSQYQEFWMETGKNKDVNDWYKLEDHYDFIINVLKDVLNKKSHPSKLEPINEFSLLNTLYFLKGIQNKIEIDDKKLVINNTIVLKIIRMIYKQSIEKQTNSSKERSHPYIYYKFLQVMEKWALEIFNDIKNNNNEWKNITEGMDKIEHIEKEEKGRKEAWEKICNYFLNNKIYDYAKFEMYRQISLHSVKDRSLFDVKRLIYSLLIVINYRYSNNLIKDKVLKLIFDEQLNSNTGLFLVGSGINPNFVIHKGRIENKTEIRICSTPILSSVECLRDIFEHKKLETDLKKYSKKLNLTYKWIVKRSWKDSSGDLEGWFSDYENTSIPESWMAGHTLLFLKTYCEILLDSIKKNTFVKLDVKKSEELTSIVEWEYLKDSYGIKKNIEYMMEENNGKWESNPKYCSALIFGPPGSGKSSIVKALAKRLEWDYVEIAPHLFLTKGKESIVPSAIQIFNRLLQMKKTVIFFDEVDQLVKSRKNANKQGSEESIWIVTSLLLKFQELRDQKDIKFILATNDITEVDIAAKRPGRIDAVLPMGAICWQDRLKILRDAIRGEDNRIEEHLEESGDIFKILINESTKLLKTHNEIYKIEKKDVQNKQLQNYLQRTNFMPFLDIKNIIERLFNKKNWESIEKEEVFKIFFVNRDNRDSEDYKNFEFENFHTKLIDKSIKDQIDEYIYLPIDADISKREYIDHIKDTIFRKC